jgi:putative ABC transport system substrate-binding protein
MIVLRRRTMLIAGTAALGIAGLPAALRAERHGRVPVLGYIAIGARSAVAQSAFYRAFHERLEALGWVAGRTIAIEYRFAEGDAARLPALARELVARKVDAIFASQRPAIGPVRDATRTIPTVFISLGDPVAEGWVASLGRPGGNLTGVAGQSPELAGKRIQFLREFVPAMRTVGVLWNSVNSAEIVGVRAMEAVARDLGIAVEVAPVAGPGDFARAIAAIAGGRSQALVVLPDPILVQHREALVRLVNEHRLPAIYMESSFVAAGGLMSYSPSLSTMFRRAAEFVDRILRGARPADLPVEQPTKFELIVNFRAAQALGLAVPPSILARADEVIE